MRDELNSEQRVRSNKKGNRTRERLFRAFLTSVNEHGYQNTHIRDVCNAAGVSVRTFYLYFSSKSDVILGLFTNSSSNFRAFISTSLEGKSARDRLEEIVRLYAHLNINTDQEQLRLILSPNQEWHNPGGVWHELSDSLNEILVGELEAGKASGEITKEYCTSFLARQMSILLRGHIYIWCCVNRNYDLEEESVASFRFIWKNMCGGE